MAIAISIREAALGDAAEWVRMRYALWPDHEPGEFEAEVAGHFAGRPVALLVLVADRGDGRLGGFAEIGERPYADGCDTSPVAYVEGWYVDADLRRQNVGAALLAAAEAWARGRGHTEMGSGCLLDNEVSLRAHLALGYDEMERQIHFRKRIG